MKLQFTGTKKVRRSLERGRFQHYKNSPEIQKITGEDEERNCAVLMKHYFPFYQIDRVTVGDFDGIYQARFEAKVKDLRVNVERESVGIYMQRHSPDKLSNLLISPEIYRNERNLEDPLNPCFSTDYKTYMGLRVMISEQLEKDEFFIF